MSHGPSVRSRPVDPRLADVVDQLRDTGVAAELLDSEWRLVWVSAELKRALGETDEKALGFGRNPLEYLRHSTWMASVTEDSARRALAASLRYLAYETPGGVEALRKIADEPFRAMLDDVEPPPPILWSYEVEFLQGDLPPLRVQSYVLRLHDEKGECFGLLSIYAPSLPAHLVALVARGDERMFERMARLVAPARRAGAVLFADLASSGPLSRRLPSAAYFRLIRAITSAVDAVVIEHGGIVGKHAGDGVTAFFLAEDLGSESGAARAAIETSRNLTEVAGAAAADLRDEGVRVEPDDCRLDIGLHWGGGLYVGQIVTGGRLEVTALGDEVNECARIEQSARDRQILASKAIVERLSEADAVVLDLDPDRLAYRTLSEIPGADDKARRDAGGIPVTDLASTFTSPR